MKFPASNRSHTAAYFSIRGVQSAWVRRSGEPSFQGDGSGSNITPARAERPGSQGSENEDRTLAVPCFQPRFRMLSCEEAELAALLPETTYFALSYSRLGHRGQSQGPVAGLLVNGSLRVSELFQKQGFLEAIFLHFPFSIYHSGIKIILGGLGCTTGSDNNN